MIQTTGTCTCSLKKNNNALACYYYSITLSNSSRKLFSTFFIENEIGKCIDYIFVTTNDFYVLQHATLTNSNNGYYRSDYSPVMDEMIFKKYLF